MYREDSRDSHVEVPHDRSSSFRNQILKTLTFGYQMHALRLSNGPISNSHYYLRY